MKKTMLILLVLLTWSSAVWGQYDYRGYGSSTQNRAYEDQNRRQEDQIRRQRYEMEDMERRARQAEADRDRLQSERYDLERQHRGGWSPYPHR